MCKFSSLEELLDVISYIVKSIQDRMPWNKENSPFCTAFLFIKVLINLQIGEYTLLNNSSSYYRFYKNIIQNFQCIVATIY